MLTIPPIGAPAHGPRDRRHLQHLHPGDEPDGVDVVHSEVEDDARACLAAQPPATQALGEQGGVGDAHPHHLAERALGDEPPQRADHRRVAQVVVGGQH